MNLKELSQLYYLKQEIEMDEERLAKLREELSSPAIPKYSNMPGGGKHENPLEEGMAKIDDLEQTIKAKKDRCCQERIRLERYIADIPDSLTRQIFTYRFVDGLSWRQVAEAVRGNNTEDGVKKICYRYIKAAKNKCCPVCPVDLCYSVNSER